MEGIRKGSARSRVGGALGAPMGRGGRPRCLGCWACWASYDWDGPLVGVAAEELCLLRARRQGTSVRSPAKRTSRLARLLAHRKRAGGKTARAYDRSRFLSRLRPNCMQTLGTPQNNQPRKKTTRRQTRAHPPLSEEVTYCCLFSRGSSPVDSYIKPTTLP